MFDLTRNDGGNMHPMLAGLAPVLGRGRLCGFLDASGHTTWVTADEEAIRVGDEITALIPKAALFPPRPAAVVVSESTLSSGEWVAVVLRAKLGAPVFGTTSGGLLTGVEPIELMGGQVIVGVAVVTAVDDTGRPVDPCVTPDADGELSEAITWAASA